MRLQGAGINQGLPVCNITFISISDLFLTRPTYFCGRDRRGWTEGLNGADAFGFEVLQSSSMLSYHGSGNFQAI